MIRNLTSLLFLLALLAAPLALRAQDEFEEEGAADAADAVERAKPAKKPAAKPSRAAEIKDPAVLSILESPAKTPADQFEQVQMLAQLGQPELAKPLLKKLLDAKLNADTRAALAEKFGTSTFLHLAKNVELAPESTEFANSVLDAADKITHDSARLAKAVKQLSDADQTNREDAVIALSRAHAFAVAPLFDALADSKRANEHAAIRAMILRLDGDAVGPLVGTLDAPDTAKQALAAELLGQLDAKKTITDITAIYAVAGQDPQLKQAAGFALQRLAGTLPSIDEAKILLERESRRKLDYAKIVDTTDNYGSPPPTAEVWYWDGKKNQAVLALDTTAGIARSNAARWSRSLQKLNPQSQTRRRLYLTALLENAKYRAGLDQPLPAGKDSAADEAAAFGLANLEDLLTDAIASGNFAAATAAAEILGRIGTADILIRPDGRHSPLAEAARSGDRRLRFAAVNSILRLAPTKPFAGAGEVGQTLKYFASTAGFKRALVAHPKSGIAQQIAAHLGSLGYEADIATNGRDAFELAVSYPDYELAVIHVAIDKMRADDLIAQLRKDPRTAQLPVAVLAIPNYEQSAQRLARGVPLTAAFAEPQDAEAVKYDVSRLLSMPGCAPLPAAARQQQAAAAVGWLLKLSEHPVSWLDVRAISPAIERALYVPGLVNQVAAFLANAGSPAGQRALLDLASRGGLPLPTRELAAIEFARSVHNHGILLTSGEILEQYNRYNNNAGQNPDTHKVLLIILEAIESKAKTEGENAEE